MKRVKITIAIVVSLLALIIVLQNTQMVETRLLFFTIAMPRALLLIVTFLVGFAMGVISASLLTGKSAATDKRTVN
ncbi:MAG TPA: LapA family protein [Sedimentisphaerales bacterium]|nr:LapA family protein [Sedimentisphaerales bacterium]